MLRTKFTAALACHASPRPQILVRKKEYAPPAKAADSSPTHRIEEDGGDGVALGVVARPAGGGRAAHAALLLCLLNLRHDRLEHAVVAALFRQLQRCLQGLRAGADDRDLVPQEANVRLRREKGKKKKIRGQERKPSARGAPRGRTKAQTQAFFSLAF